MATLEKLRITSGWFFKYSAPNKAIWAWIIMGKTDPATNLTVFYFPLSIATFKVVIVNKPGDI